ncbi:GNAT family N-acetyltransferase [Pseudonocardia xinjiangensis]|uniref:GNAT family N-acetyltransferase n=1 Tax=Pseudonocardia xinjiangensis TaxID=75289 RepID=A0ABX1R6Z8_9PSEU|nr:GNAT family N-acetyltransferase [Pseudonocardia xinjiangensis]NMH75561.1 GNAT family N-acetyltransferase [Pseudonocardia xinjiangensis]
MPTTTADCELAVRVLVTAFADDPVARWLLPGGAAERVFRPVVQQSAALGELAVSADGAAVAVWLPRGAEPPAPDVESLPDHLVRLRTFMTLTERRHPSGRAHLYLVFLGVRPDAQGRGLGGALLRDRLSRADDARMPAYLEASSPRNLPLYERHGFRVTGDPITLPDGPPLWPMWRDPRP